MGTIIPVPAGRTSEMLIRHRLLAQVGSSQQGLLKLETQIASGQRLMLPSDDAPAALRAIDLQRLLDRKGQLRTNLATNQSFLGATDAALSQVSSLLINVRGTAQAVVGTVATNQQREAVADQVHSALTQLINTANQQFRGRYLFAGSRSDVRPFQTSGDAVAYHGNQGSLASFADINLLFASNSDGDTVFGAVSAQVEGTVDLNPVLQESTKLADLHGGRGISRGKISISDGSATSIVDLSGAETVGDIVAMLERNPPAGRLVSVNVGAAGLEVSLDSVGGGALTIKEVASGTTAADLGILNFNGTGVGPVIGKDLDPQLTRTTRLADLLGTRAKTTIASPGAANDLVIEAQENGAPLNDVQVSFVNNSGLTPGQELATYDANTKTLVVEINPGHSTLENVINAINGNPQVAALFHAFASSHDQGLTNDAGSTFVDVTATGTTAGGAGTAFDQQAGMRISSGQETYLIDTSQAETVEDLLNVINTSSAGALAEINASATGINIRSRLSGADFSIGENGGQTASQLGVRSLTTSTRLEDLNHGTGVQSVGGSSPDFIIRRPDGVDVKINISTAKTLGDVIDLINNNPVNQNPSHRVLAQLAKFGNGIELVSEDNTNAATFAVVKSGTSQAAIELGLIPKGSAISTPAVTSAGVRTITGRDTNPREVDGAFTALVRLEAALRANDDQAVSRAIGLLDESTSRVNLARADIGARQQGLETLQAGLETEAITLKESLSNELDTDLPAAVSELAGRQAAFQAALQTAATVSRMSLLDFL